MNKINPNPRRSEEPVWWSLFGAGGSWFAMLTPVTVLMAGILVPLGVIDASAMSYERMQAVAGSWLGKAVIAGTIILPLWHAMHRIHHGIHDLGVKAGLASKVVCYGFAALVSVVTLVLLFTVL
ncbi:fumarate reductase subunit FrdD [Oceanimonas baumannii]|uniref:fumarate reductase subunit FrdD n=1 Tax=Oceanimonas baumannii TaxID=129578 RepID=UPI001D19889C|nr:fumarate reductase subunit FrdD [Oceanimonas baumannii]MCC4265915.1 fumarate reductase subunit FrdD [Oceanimonas baumannii]